MKATILEKEVRLPPIRVYRGDDNGDAISFECAARYGEKDLSAAAAYMKFLRSDWYADKVLLEKSADEDAIRFDWKIDAAQTAVAGPLRMQIVFEGTDFVFQTEVFTLDVLPSITGEEVYEREDVMAFLEEQLAGMVKRAEMETYVAEQLAGVSAPDLTDYVKNEQLALYAQKEELSAFATKNELSGYATAAQVAACVTQNELQTAIAACNASMEVVTVSGGSVLDLEPNKIYVYSEAHDNTRIIMATFDELLWTTGDRAMLIFTKSVVSEVTAAVMGGFGLPVFMSGTDCDAQGRLMGSNGMRYTVEFFFDGVNVQGKVLGVPDPNLA